MIRNDTWCAASLCLYSRVLSAREIARVLGAEGSSQIEKGTRVSARPTITRVYEDSVWSLDSTLVDSETVENHIEDLLSFAEAKAEELASLAADCDIRIWVSFSARSGQVRFALDPRTLKRFGGLNITLELSSLFGGHDNDV